MDAPAGWYRTDDGEMRYWDGTGWTEHVAPSSSAAAPPTATPRLSTAGGSEPAREGPAQSAVAGWLGWGGLLLTAALGAVSSGVSGLLILSGLFVLIVGVIALVRGRVGWARLRSRAAAGTTLGTAIVLLVAGSVVADPGPPAAPVTAPSTSSVPQRTPSSTAAPSPSTTAAATPSRSSSSATPSPSTAPAVAAAPDVTATPVRKPAATSPGQAAHGTALAGVAVLTVKGRAPKTGYSRDAFGQAWFDADRNGCDTRNDMLRRDLVSKMMKNPCKVLAGTLAPGPYTGATIRFEYGGASEVDLDHVVALGDAWQKGAVSWPAGKRLAFANDPLNLLAVDASTNRAKGEGDAATWLPPNKSYRCPYVARQVTVKRKYGFWVTTAEQDAMTRVLTTCPTQPLPAAGPAPTVAALPSSRPTLSPTPKPAQKPAPQPTPAPAQKLAPQPKPAQKPAPEPEPAEKSSARVVHPGAFCSPLGAGGITSKGTLMRCSLKTGDSRARWRKG